MTVSEIDIPRERRRIGNEQINLRYNISVRQREIDQLRGKLARLDNDLRQLDYIEEARRLTALQELLRMCNTPCWRYRAG